MDAARPNRREVISLLAAGLKPLEFVLAAWLEGADARGRVDEYSDIDLWLDITDGYEDQALAAVQRSLEGVGPLELCVEVEHPHPLIRQAFYRLEGVPEFLVVDTCVQSHSRQFVFTRGMEGEPTFVLFDKASVVRYQDLDEQVLRAESLARLGRLEQRLAVYPTWVRKELARGRFLESLAAYRGHVLEPLVEALRLRFALTKADFHLKDVSTDLPPEVVARLEELYSVRDSAEIARRLPVALEMLTNALAEVRGALTDDGQRGGPQRGASSG